MVVAVSKIFLGTNAALHQMGVLSSIHEKISRESMSFLRLKLFLLS